VLDLTIIKSKFKITGIERVALESIRHILKIASSKQLGFKFYILCSKEGKELIENELSEYIFFHNISLYRSPVMNRLITDQIWMPIAIRKIAPDLVFYTTLGIPIINNYPYFIIIHDAVPWALPNTVSKGMKYYYKPLLQHSINNKLLKRIMTVSEFSKCEIIKYLSVDKSKIFVNYLGTTDFSTDTTLKDSKQVLKDYGIDSKYIITIGTLEPRKNIQGLIKAFCILKQKYKFEGKLVIVGRKGWLNSLEITEEIKTEIVLTGYVSDEELRALLINSNAFIFPSFYEGFGLPLIEAMSLGVPIASSNRASLPEIGGDLCEYFNPENIEDMALKINKVLNKTISEFDIHLLKKRAKKFTWEKHSENIINEFLGVGHENN
jgi:glycosyltransferase involved in cell wall biosynthesis